MRIFKPILLSSIILLISSCGLTNMANKYDTVKYTVTPPVLQTHGGEIEVKIDGNFPEKYFAKKATVELTPVLIYNDNQSETAFEKIILQGEETTGGDKTIFLILVDLFHTKASSLIKKICKMHVLSYVQLVKWPIQQEKLKNKF